MPKALLEALHEALSEALLEALHKALLEAKLCSYLSKLRHDSISADFQSARKLTNYVSATPSESRLSMFRITYKQIQQFLCYGDCGY